MSEVRQFRWADYDRVVAVWQESGIDVLPRPELEAKLARDPELFLVAESGEDLAGVVLGTYDGRRGWIFRLGVHPRHRRRGVATRLVAELESRLRALGCPRINLLVLPDNEAGLRFWQDLGYLPYPDVLCSKPISTSAQDAVGAAVRPSGR
jgi:ribosomal protein S18 acetylase RimI-like enzyme